MREAWQGTSYATRGLITNESHLKQVENHLAKPPLPLPAADPSARPIRISAADSRFNPSKTMAAPDDSGDLLRERWSSATSDTDEFHHFYHKWPKGSSTS